MKVFVTGAPGYIGGTVCTALLAAGHRIVGLTRKEEDAKALRKQGVQPVLGLLSDGGLLFRLASEADAVVNAADTDDAVAIRALVAALRGSGKVLIHTGGSGIVADGAWGQSNNAIYSDESAFVALRERQPRADLMDFVLGSASDGVNAAVIHPSMVYGLGTGLRPDSIQMPLMIAAAWRYGCGVHIGDGANRWSNVHVEDLADLYIAVLERGTPRVSYFAESGENSMQEIATAISRTMGASSTKPGSTDEIPECADVLMKKCPLNWDDGSV